MILADHYTVNVLHFQFFLIRLKLGLIGEEKR